MAAVEIFSLNSDFRKFEKGIRQTAMSVLRHLRGKHCYLEIYLVPDQEMKFLNKKFRGKNTTANVLSFNEPKRFIYPPSRKRRLGEIYLNIPFVKRRAAGDFEVTLARLLIHGFLHLLGYTHGRKNDRIKMEKKELKLLKTVISK